MAKQKKKQPSRQNLNTRGQATEKPPRDSPQEEPQSFLGKQWARVKNNPVTTLTLLIALLGGAPGIVTVYDALVKPWRTDLQINYDAKQSAYFLVRSIDPTVNGKPAVLLHLLTIAGKGQNPFYPAKFTLHLKCKNGWLEGAQIRPSKTEDYISGYAISQTGPKSYHIEFLHIRDWNDFAPRTEELPLGKPYRFSYLASFNLSGAEIRSCNGLKIKIEDYLQNSFEKTIDHKFLTTPPKEITLCMKPLPECKEAAQNDVKKLQSR